MTTVYEPLTGREIDVLRRISAGNTMDQVALATGMATRTVKSHLTHVYQKLGASNGVHAVVIAISLGLIDPREVLRDARDEACE